MSSDSFVNSSAAGFATSEESGEIFLGSTDGWIEEAEAVIKDVEKFVEKIFISQTIQVQLSPNI